MARAKSLNDKLRGAAVLKMSFRLRQTEGSPAFQGVYPGVLESLGISDEQVESYIQENRLEVERLAQSGADDGDD